MGLNRRNFLQVSGSGAALMIAGSGIAKKGVFAAVPPRWETSDVSFVGSSSTGTRKQVILDALEPWRDMVAEQIEDKKILVKPNVVSYSNQLIATHVDALRAVVEFLRSITTQDIVIGESAASRGVSTGFQRLGYNNIANEYDDVAVVDLDDYSEITTVKRNVWKPDLTSTNEIRIHSPFTDPEYYIISVTRPKTHAAAVITGVCKNILMGSPAVDNKQLMHGKIGWWSGMNQGEAKCLNYNLFQLGNILFSNGVPALSVLDAWEGMEGNGPAGGTSIMQYCAIVGSDPLAVDRLMAKLMGLSDTPTEPMDKNHPSYTDARALYWLSNAGIGNYDLSKINFILGSLEELEDYVKTYDLPPLYTGSPSYATNWTGGPPDRVLDSEYVVAVEDSRFLDPKPYLATQMNSAISNRRVTIAFSLPTGFPINLAIYDLKGSEVRRLGYEYLPSGKYSVVWDCRDNHGTAVSSGRYIIRLTFDGKRSMSDQITIL